MTHDHATNTTDQFDKLRESARDLIAAASDTYKKRNGHLSTFEDESGEKCWIVPFDAFESLRSALEALMAADTEQSKPETAPSERVTSISDDGDIVEAMVLSLKNPFPSESLMRAGGIDYWREIMRGAYRAALTTITQGELLNIDWFETSLNIIHDHKKVYVVERDNLKHSGEANATVYAKFVEVCDSISQAIHDMKKSAGPVRNMLIKPLEWRTDLYGAMTATHPFGSYSCPRFHDAWDLMRNGLHVHPKVHGVIQTYPSLEAAKDAAQVDFEKRASAILELATGANSVPAKLLRLTFAVQHNPNCPAPWLVRLPGKSGTIDMKPYRDVIGIVKHETGDRLGFGKTFGEAARSALTASADTSTNAS
jgi:hypothetical protein